MLGFRWRGASRGSSNRGVGVVRAFGFVLGFYLGFVGLARFL